MKNHIIATVFVSIVLIIQCTPSSDSDVASESDDTLYDEEYLDTLTEEEEYYLSGNPDTALARYLYNEYKAYDPNEEFIAYQRWDLEHEYQTKLIQSLYGSGPETQAVLLELEKIRLDIIQWSRKQVLDDYDKYHSINGPGFDFLVERKDSVIKPLIERILIDSLATPSDRDYALKMKKKLEAF